MVSGCVLGAGLVSGSYFRFERESLLSEESARNVVPVMHDLSAAEGCSVRGVQNPALRQAGAIGHEGRPQPEWSQRRAGPAANASGCGLLSTNHVPTTRRPPSAGPARSMRSVEAETLINARSSAVWDVITDARNFTVWESGITRIRGELRNGGTIRIRTHIGGERTFRLRVQQMPGEVMTWTQGLPLGLLTGVRTFRLEPLGGMTHLLVKEEFTGPLCGLLLWEFVSDTQQAFIDYVSAVRKRAEILGRHLRTTGS